MTLFKEYILKVYHNIGSAWVKQKFLIIVQFKIIIPDNQQQNYKNSHG